MKKDEPYKVAVGIKRKGEKGFKINSTLDQQQSDPHVGPHLIHNGNVSCCSECAQPVNIPTGTCAPCPHCGAQFGGCG